MKWRIYPSQRGLVNRLVRRRCCCYDHGSCILLDDGEPHHCVQIISRSGIYCNYFHRAVLPVICSRRSSRAMAARVST